MDAFLHYLTEWGYIGMFISAFLAGTILPFSSEAVLLACIGLGLKQLDKASRFIHGKGAWMALFSFLPVIGDAILIVLGLMRAHIGIVTFSMTLGKLIRYVLLVAATLGIFRLF